MMLIANTLRERCRARILKDVCFSAAVIRVFLPRLKVHLLAAEVLMWNRSMSSAYVMRLPLLWLCREETNLLLPVWRLCTVLVQIVIVSALGNHATRRGAKMLEGISRGRSLLHRLP